MINKISIREDLHNQYINQISNITFKDLEDNYNHFVDLLNALSNTTNTYVICLIAKDTLKYISYCVGNKFYTDKHEALKVANDLNYKRKSLNEEYCIELVQNKFDVTTLANIAYNLLKE